MRLRGNDMRGRAINATTLLIAVGLFGCSEPITVSTDYDKGADFASFKTYEWAPRKGGEPETQSLTDQRIRNAVDAELQEKGMTKAASIESADVLMGYHLTAQNKVQVYDYGYGWGWGRNIDVSSYTEGTLFVDMIDPEAQQLVWRGIASAAVSQHSNDESLVNRAVDQMFWDYPPKK